MRKIFTAVLLVFILRLSSFGQDSNLPKLIDEFVSLNSEDLTARLEAVPVVLKQNPKAKGYIIIYSDKDLPFGFSIRYGVRIQNFLVKNLNLSPKRFEIINGGLIDKRNTQLWISPDGTKPPLIDSTQKEFEFNKTSLFDRFNYPMLYDDAGCCSIDNYKDEEKKASLGKFAEQIKQHPTAQAYLIFYGQYRIDGSSDIELDSSATITRILRKERNSLHKHYGIDYSKIITINGGYREWQALELWIVPKGGEIPKPKPETFPKKRRSKK